MPIAVYIIRFLVFALAFQNYLPKAEIKCGLLFMDQLQIERDICCVITPCGFSFSYQFKMKSATFSQPCSPQVKWLLPSNTFRSTLLVLSLYLPAIVSVSFGGNIWSLPP